MPSEKQSRAAATVVEEFGLAEPGEYYHECLVEDDRFAAACLLYQEAGVYASGEDAVEADREARECLRRSVREHAQRVEGDLDRDGQEGEADA